MGYSPWGHKESDKTEQIGRQDLKRLEEDIQQEGL